MLYTLEKCNLRKILASKNSDYKGTYLSTLKIIEKPVGDLLEFTKTNFPNYTDHTIQHSYRILRYIYCILSEKMKENLSATEIFCLIAAAMLHDIGMSNFTEADKEELRKNHAQFAKEPIIKFFDHLKFIDNMQRIKTCILYVCESHTKSLTQLYAEPQFKIKDTINAELVRYGFLSILLRVGDLMDMEEDRTSYMARTIFPEYYQKAGSSAHHQKCDEIQTYNYNSESIEVFVETNNRINYKLWSNWFVLLKDEITQANTYYFRDFVAGESLPKFEYKIQPINGANFSTEEIRFEIDDKGALWTIISNSVYTTENDFMRELIQNAIDACLMDCYLYEKNNLPCASQREWPIENYCVNIMFSEELNELTIYDNGVGMEIDALKKYLFKTADSGYKHINVERNFSFPAIAKFGIGFVSCLTKANRIKICTQGSKSNEQIIVEIEKDSNLAFIDRQEKTNYHGTVISLVLKDKCTYANIEKYLKDYFHEPAIKIYLCNLDILSEFTDNKEIFENLSLKSVNQILSRKESIMSQLAIMNSRQQSIYTLISNCDTLRQLLINTNADELFPLDKIMQYHALISTMLEQNKEIFDDKILKNFNRYTKTSIDLNHDKYENLLSIIIEKSSNYRKENLDILIKQYNNIETKIGNIQWQKLMIEDICIIYLDNNFYIDDIEYQIDSEKIKEQSGIIFIKTEYIDSNLGIEFAIVNAFIFNNGNLTQNLIKAQHNNFVSDDFDENSIISLDEIHDIQYQLQLAFEDEEEEEKYIRQVKNLEDEKFSYLVDVLYGDGDLKIVRNQYSNTISEKTFEEGALFLPNASYNSHNIPALIPEFKESLFCQDGIKLDVDLSGLIPFKVGYYKCNFFGESRFELNVTRHDINRNSSLINQWMTNYGRKIQAKVIENITDTLKKCGITSAYLEDNLRQHTCSSFEEGALCQFKTLLKM